MVPCDAQCANCCTRRPRIRWVVQQDTVQLGGLYKVGEFHGVALGGVSDLIWPPLINFLHFAPAISCCHLIASVDAAFHLRPSSPRLSRLSSPLFWTHSSAYVTGSGGDLADLRHCCSAANNETRSGLQKLLFHAPAYGTDCISFFLFDSVSDRLFCFVLCASVPVAHWAGKLCCGVHYHTAFCLWTVIATNKELKNYQVF